MNTDSTISLCGEGKGDRRVDDSPLDTDIVGPIERQGRVSKIPQQPARLEDGVGILVVKKD